MSVFIYVWSGIFILNLVWLAYKYKNVFHPVFFFLGFQFIEYALPLIVNEPLGYAEYSTENIIQVILLETLFVFSFLAGYYIRIWNKNIVITNNPFKVNSTEYNMFNAKGSYIVIFALYGIGMLSRVMLIIKMGGIAYVLSNSHAAYNSIMTGAGLISTLARLMLISIVCLFEKVLVQRKTIDKLLLFFMCLIYMASYLIYSSRGPALELILVLMCCYSMNKKKISIKDIIKPKYIILFVIVLILAMTALSRRTGASNQSFTMMNSLEALVNEYNRVDRDIFSYSYFRSHSRWHGRSYLNILYMFIPSKIWPNKPVTDDGLFLMNLILGRKVDPTMGRLDMDLTIGSVPFTSQGLAYANFGVIGIIFAGYLTGKLFRFSYKKVNETNSTTTTLIYFYVIYIFGFTPLYIQNIISVTFFALVCRWLIYRKIKV